MNIDNVHEIFLRGRTGYQDFNDKDSFDGRGDEIIDPDFQRAYYRFDLRRALEWTAAGLCSQISIENGGVPIKVPDFRDPAQRPIWLDARP